MANREQNERKFTDWAELQGGGRRYWLDVEGHLGWRARYVKIVDRNEKTLRFWQEIYDNTGKLMEKHVKFPVKFPVDEGHQKA
jgi:hypothetical protein